MFALTILYCLVFFYIRIQLKHLRQSSSASQIESADQSQWQSNLESRRSATPIPPREIRTTHTVQVTSEDFRLPKRIISGPDKTQRRISRATYTLLGYPIIYICLTMPLCISRLSEFAGQEWGSNAVYVGACIYTCTGFCNVLLYSLTRKGIVSWKGLFARGDKKRETPFELEYRPRCTSGPKKSLSFDSLNTDIPDLTPINSPGVSDTMKPRVDRLENQLVSERHLSVRSDSALQMANGHYEVDLHLPDVRQTSRRMQLRNSFTRDGA